MLSSNRVYNVRKYSQITEETAPEKVDKLALTTSDDTFDTTRLSVN